MSGPELPRRRFLCLAGAAVLAPSGCSSGVQPADVGDVSAGNVSALSVDSLRAIGSDPVCIGRDANGAYAMTLTCTHAGCNIAESGSVSYQGIQCACHGSQFDANGNVVRGPAGSPLQHFAVTADSAGNLTIHGGQEVGADVRLKV